MIEGLLVFIVETLHVIIVETLHVTSVVIMLSPLPIASLVRFTCGEL